MKLSASARKITLDLHPVVGFFASAFICILAITGLVKGYGDVLQPHFDSVTGLQNVWRAHRPKASQLNTSEYRTLCAYARFRDDVRTKYSGIRHLTNLCDKNYLTGRIYLLRSIWRRDYDSISELLSNFKRA